MPSMFDDLFSSVGFPVLGNVFGEPAEYLFRSGSIAGISGTTREFSDAIVFRNPPESVNEKGEVYQPKFKVQLNLDPKLVNVGGDKIRIREHANDTDFKTYGVYKLESQAGMVVTLEVI